MHGFFLIFYVPQVLEEEGIQAQPAADEHSDGTGVQGFAARCSLGRHLHPLAYPLHARFERA